MVANRVYVGRSYLNQNVLMRLIASENSRSVKSVVRDFKNERVQRADNSARLHKIKVS